MAGRKTDRSRPGVVTNRFLSIAASALLLAATALAGPIDGKRVSERKKGRDGQFVFPFTLIPALKSRYGDYR